MRTAKRMGIKTVAIYSEADAHSLHVRMADEAFCVGPPQSSESYLNISAIMDAIKKTGAQAVHPGYGFLSENAHFCDVLDKAGVIFIGPSADSMAKLGDKIESKIIAKEAGVHTVPGFNGVVKDETHALRIANEIGYPVMIKASAGGGGKGMRIVRSDKEMLENFRLAASESKSSFGDDRMLVEKYIESPRHVEIQILGDQHGNILYLPERECSIQRRNQKVIEEAPSTAIDEKTRAIMGKQAAMLSKHVGYFSAGTVEFLVDPKSNFYFLEMNTRLQVEHPITEYVTGLDLVEQMIRIAAGQKLVLRQADIKIKGWAFESRVYAEDPAHYLPCIGRLTQYQEPGENDPDVRCDSGIKEGSDISIYYDPLICKLSTYGPDRQAALTKMNEALDSYIIKGVTHNVSLLREVFTHPKFIKGDISTNFLPEEFPQGFLGHRLSNQELGDLACIAAFVWKKNCDQTFSSQGEKSRGNLKDKIYIQISSYKPQLMEIGRATKDEYLVNMNDEATSISLNSSWPLKTTIIHVTLNGRSNVVQFIEQTDHGFVLQYHGTRYPVKIDTVEEHGLYKFILETQKPDLSKLITSPMPGQIIHVNVAVGDIVKEGIDLVAVEAMKMQNVLRAARPGKVVAVNVVKGQSVSAEETLIEIEDIQS